MLIEKVLLGITLSAPIGPVSLEMIKRGLNKGFLDAFIVRLGGAIGNTLCLIGAYFGLSLVLHSETTMAICCLAGSLVLIYLGMKSFLDKRRHQLTISQDPPSYTVLNGLATGFVLSIANPIGIIFWLSIFAATLDRTQGAQNWLGLLENFAVIGGVLLWWFFLSCMLEMGKRFFNHKFIKIITTLAGGLLIAFGIKYGYKAILLLT